MNPFSSLPAGRSAAGLALVILLAWGLVRAETPLPPPVPLYTEAPGSPDGLGKWFLGREIAHYMTHHGASWLERPERDDEERPVVALDLLDLHPGETVADVGAGSGYFSWRVAQRVGPTGRVYATDIQPEMLAILRTNMAAKGVTNVIPVLGTTEDPKLPANALDLIVLVDVYHECDHPYEMVRGFVQALKPGGRLAFVEYRAEERWIPIKPLHKMTEEQVRKEMSLHPLEWVGNLRGLPRQHLLVFRKSAAAATSRKPDE